MTEIEQFIVERKARSPKAWANFEAEYDSFRIGLLLALYRENAGLTLTTLAKRANMQKAALSKLENHGENVQWSTIVRYVEAAGRPMAFRISPTGKRPSIGGKPEVSVELQSAHGGFVSPKDASAGRRVRSLRGIQAVSRRENESSWLYEPTPRVSEQWGDFSASMRQNKEHPNA